MDTRFEFQRLLPNLRWEVVMKMEDRELINLCRSSNAMQDFCNTRDWFWRDRAKSKFGIDPTDLDVQIMLRNNNKNWFRVYLILVKLNKLKQKLSPYLDDVSLIELYYMETLQLEGSNFTKLPPEIGQLVNLRTLDVLDGQLKELPSEIGQLVNLRTLMLTNNQIKEIPPEIGQLVNLEHIYLSSNQLTTIPREIENLDKLELLWLNNNQLTELPVIKFSSKLYEFYLDENPKTVEELISGPAQVNPPGMFYPKVSLYYE